jgi:glycerol-3-phosphate acyltransferase PlsX
MRISLDAYGGDFAPDVNIRGALDYLEESKKAEVILTGSEEKLKALLGKGHPRISIVHAPDLIDMAEKASSQLRHRKESSLYKCIDLTAQGATDACVSAGSSAAMMALSLLLLKRIKDVERPALVTPIPTLKKEPCYGLDMGANVDCKPIHLLHFALMGHAYAQVIKNIDRPRIGLISNGEEETKGNELTRETHQLLKAIPEINYAGYCEGRDIFTGDFDVVICDGFVGNVILKTSEGLAETLMHLLKANFSSSLLGKLGYLLARNSLRPLKQKLDYAEYGGAPLLGIGGVSIISHGRSSALAIKNALHAAEKNVKEGLVKRLNQAMNFQSPTLAPKEALNEKVGQ